jgi:hypothetical protein
MVYCGQGSPLRETVSSTGECLEPDITSVLYRDTIEPRITCDLPIRPAITYRCQAMNSLSTSAMSDERERILVFFGNEPSGIL